MEPQFVGRAPHDCRAIERGSRRPHSRLRECLDTCPRRVISRYWSHEAQSRAQRGQRLEPGQGLLPEARAEEDRPRRVLRRRRAVRPAAPAPAPLPHEAVPERRRPRLLPPEAGAGEPSAVRRRAIRRVPERPLDRVRHRRQRRGARVGREPRVHRAAHVALACPRHRAARLPPHRPRPDVRGAVATRAEDRSRRQGRDGRARAEELPEDVRVDRAARPRADQAGARLSRRCGGWRRRWRRRSSGGSATSAWRRRRGRWPTGCGVFVDYGQNARDRTIASAYSIRPVPDARASAPLDWDEVADRAGRSGSR